MKLKQIYALIVKENQKIGYPLFVAIRYAVRLALSILNLKNNVMSASRSKISAFSLIKYALLTKILLEKRKIKFNNQLWSQKDLNY